MIKKLQLIVLILLANVCVNAQTLPVSSGTGSAYNLSVPGIVALKAGITVKFQANVVSVSSATINVNSSGATAILEPSGSALSAGYIVANQIVELVYNGSSRQIISPSGASGGSISGSGTTDYLAKWSATTNLSASLLPLS